jgi:Fe2+ or Zn2+ uptake regulation protein
VQVSTAVAFSEQMTNDSTLDQRILKYLQERPQACDTLQGIASWWVMCQQVNDSIIGVQQVLETLKAQGLVRERKTLNGRTLYYISEPEQENP